MQLDHRIRKVVALLPLLSAAIAFEASEAVRIEIPEHRLAPSGAGARGVMYVTNNSEQASAFQIDVASRSHDLDGNETNVRAGDEWSVLPRQLLLPPHSEKLVSIVWKGLGRLDSERSYRVVIQQLPIELDTLEAHRDDLGHELR